MQGALECTSTPVLDCMHSTSNSTKKRDCQALRSAAPLKPGHCPCRPAAFVSCCFRSEVDLLPAQTAAVCEHRNRSCWQPGFLGMHPARCEWHVERHQHSSMLIKSLYKRKHCASATATAGRPCQSVMFEGMYPLMMHGACTIANCIGCMCPALLVTDGKQSTGSAVQR